MTIEEIKKYYEESEEYSSVRNEKHAKILVGLGGSYSYGTNTENSDIDIRGIALNTKNETLSNQQFNQYVDNQTDTTIYGFNKMIELLSKCNPNTIELLGLKPEHYIYRTAIGNDLIQNSKMFLSQIAAQSFGGYAYAQLRRLDNKSNRLLEEEAKKQHIINSIKNASYDFKTRYYPYEDNDIKLTIDKKEANDTENNSNDEYDIYMNIKLTHYPLRDYVGLWSEMKNIVRDYDKFGKRNTNAVEHNKLAKHMRCLIYLYLSGIDILSKEQIITYRPEHELLMNIQNGKYLTDEQQPTDEFWDLLNEKQKEFEYATANTSLPNKPNYTQIQEYLISVNEQIVKGEV